jgi:hypothetical protein
MYWTRASRVGIRTLSQDCQMIVLQGLTKAIQDQLRYPGISPSFIVRQFKTAALATTVRSGLSVTRGMDCELVSGIGPAGNAKSAGGPTLNARRTRDAQKMGKVSGLAANSNAIGFPIVVVETLRHCQHLCDRIRAACGYQTIPPACEWNQGNHIGPEQALPSEWSYERRRQCDKNRRE